MRQDAASEFEPSRRKGEAVLRAYYWVFYALYRMNGLQSARFDREWTTLVLYSVVQFLAVASALYSVALITHGDFVFRIPKAAVIATFLGLAAINYWATLWRRSWCHYGRAFERLQRKPRRNAMLLSYVAVACVIGVFFGVSYEYRKGPIGRAAAERIHHSREQTSVQGRAREGGGER
jgi:hypothetical protein